MGDPVVTVESVVWNGAAQRRLWRAVAEAVHGYADVPAETEHDPEFRAARHRLRRAALRWAVPLVLARLAALGIAVPENALNGLAGDGRPVTGQRMCPGPGDGAGPCPRGAVILVAVDGPRRQRCVLCAGVRARMRNVIDSRECKRRRAAKARAEAVAP